MNELADRYQGKTTAKGHEIRVDQEKDRVILWYLHWGEVQGVDAHHHMGIADIRRNDQGYTVGLLRGTSQRPSEIRDFASMLDVLAALDEEISRR